MAPMMTNCTVDVDFPPGLQDDAGFEHVWHAIAVILGLVYAGSMDVLLIVSSIMWAGIQQKIVLHLTATMAFMQWNPESRRYEPPEPGFTDDGHDPFDTDNGFLFYLLCCYLHLSMYIDFVKVEIPIGSPFIQAVAVGLVPLAIPYWFYAEWPVVSRGFLLCWAQIWLEDTYIWIMSMMFLLLCIEFVRALTFLLLSTKLLSLSRISLCVQCYFSPKPLGSSGIESRAWSHRISSIPTWL